MARRPGPPASYTSDKMERQLRKGNVAEALFRLWTEDHAALLPNLTFRQQGYNPAEIVGVEAKRDELKRKSDPDFAAIRKGTKAPEYVVGISVNGQKSGYTAASTMGGLCIRCPRGLSCLDGHESNVWYNRYNITNDYPQFRQRYAGIDVVLVTIMLPSIDTIFGKVRELGWESLVFDYIVGGSAEIEGSPQADEMMTYLRFGSRGKTRRHLEVRYVLQSDLESGAVPHFVTGGLSQYGRPREVCCVDIRLTHGEDQLLDYLSRL